MKFLTLILVISITVPLLGQEGKGVDLPGEASKKTRKINPAFAKVVDDPALPRVLIIGDSISIGYTVSVREALAGEANVHRIPGNAGDTDMGLAGLPKWLNEKNVKWDLIHFNWGLWDLCYRNPESKNQGHRDKVEGTLTHTPEQYAENLEAIVQALEATDAKLIFATTTPIPEGEAGRKVGDDRIYNEAALNVMRRHEIGINDLYSVMAGKMKKFGGKPGDVHFTEQGYALLGVAVGKSIKAALKP